MRRGPPRGVALALLLAALALPAVAARAQEAAAGAPPDAEPACPGPEGASLTIEGFGRVEYRDVVTDRAADRVDFSGGVCFSAADGSWRILARGLTVLDASSDDPGLRIARALLRVEGTEVRSREVVLRRDQLLLDGVAVLGADLVGTAARGSYDTLAGVLELAEPDLRTTSVALRGRRARFAANTLTLFDGSVTTCACEGEPRYRVESDEVRFTLGERTVYLEGAAIRTSGGTLELGDLALDESAAAAFSLPLSLATPPGGNAQRLSDTLTLLLDGVPLAPGLVLEAGVAGLDAAPLVGVARVRYRQPEALRRPDGLRVGATVAFPWDGVIVESRLERPLAPRLALGFGIRQRHTPRDDFLHDATLDLTATADGRPRPWLELDGTLTPFAAVSSQTFGGVSPLGPRLGARASGRARADLGAAGDLSLAVDGGATLYPGGAYGDDAAPSQLWLRLRPAHRFEIGPLVLNLNYDRRLVAGGSPFSTRLDRVEPLHRVGGELRLGGAPAPGVAASLRSEVRVRFAPEVEVPGADRLRAEAALRLPAPGGRATFAVATRLEGLLGPDGGLDAWVEARAGYSDPAELLTGQLRLRYDLGDGAVSDLVVAASAPLRRGEVTLTPYLALDLARLLAGGAVELDGHGLLLDLDTCCGDLRVGYRSGGSGSSVTLAFALETRPIDPSEGAFDAIPAARDPLPDPEIDGSGDGGLPDAVEEFGGEGAP